MRVRCALERPRAVRLVLYQHAACQARAGPQGPRRTEQVVTQSHQAAGGQLTMQLIPSGPGGRSLVCRKRLPQVCELLLPPPPSLGRRRSRQSRPICCGLIPLGATLWTFGALGDCSGDPDGSELPSETIRKDTGYTELVRVHQHKFVHLLKT